MPGGKTINKGESEIALLAANSETIRYEMQHYITYMYQYMYISDRAGIGTKPTRQNKH